MRGKTALWGLATAFSAVAAFGAVQNSQNAQNATMTDARGEQILNQSCSSCHELRNIETQALDADGWTKMVNSMIEKGSTIKKDDVPASSDIWCESTATTRRRRQRVMLRCVRNATN